jgi:hypothetical protein
MGREYKIERFERKKAGKYLKRWGEYVEKRRKVREIVEEVREMSEGIKRRSCMESWRNGMKLVYHVSLRYN